MSLSSVCQDTRHTAAPIILPAAYGVIVTPAPRPYKSTAIPTRETFKAGDGREDLGDEGGAAYSRSIKNVQLHAAKTCETGTYYLPPQSGSISLRSLLLYAM